jgi:N6-L-threonylcarbamoyladenine synthase
MKNPTIILAIETSCDETAAAVIHKKEGILTVLSSIVSSQIALHAPFGGVVPDLAAREHAKNIVPVIQEALREAKISYDDISALAVTQGPGLIPALLIGVAAAKTLSLAWHKPLLGIHHIEGHIYANMLNHKETLLFPLLALVVSGGHTQLVLMRDHFVYEILGETKDDAVGEAFDKVAKMLGLPYPGGPVVAKRADAFTPLTVPSFHFPRPMIHSGDYNFSFSGLKTSVLYTIKKTPEKLSEESFLNEICFEFQEAVIETLLTKTHHALTQFLPKTFVIAGGVSANISLRVRLEAMTSADFPNTQFLMPSFAHSLDNAAMIGAAACMRFDAADTSQKEIFNANGYVLTAKPNLSLVTMHTTIVF